jgi:hypothetical protein
MHLSRLIPFRATRHRAPDKAGAERPRARPLLERLEKREVPAVSANQEYVAVLSQGLLGHAADATTLKNSSQFLDAGGQRILVTSSFLARPEYRANSIEKLYETILGRPADLGSLSSYTHAMGNVVRGNMSLDDIRAQLFGSTEFFLRSGGTPASFLKAVYNDILGRSPDPAALVLLGQALDEPGRTQIARTLLQSPEVAVHKTLNDFQDALGQTPDLATGSFFVNAYLSGNRDEGVLAFLLMSGQFYNPIVADAAATPLTDPNAAAALYLNSTHLLRVQEPNNPTAAPTTATLVLSPSLGPATLPSGFDATGNPGLGTFGAGGFNALNGNGTGTNGTGTGTTGTGTGTNQGTSIPTGTTGTTNSGQTGFGTTGTGTTIGSGTGGGTTGTGTGTIGTTGGTTGTTGITGTGGTTGATGVGTGTTGGTGLTGPGTPTG